MRIIVEHREVQRWLFVVNTFNKIFWNHFFFSLLLPYIVMFDILHDVETIFSFHYSQHLKIVS